MSIKSLFLIFNLFLISLAISGQCPLREGDIIFQETRNAQSKYIKKVTQSPWTHVGSLVKHEKSWKVIEAVQPVKLTPLTNFVQRSVNKNIQLKRYYDSKNNTLNDQQIQKLNKELFRFLNRPYDLLFEWDDEKIYCSELIYKGYNTALNIEIGQIQKIKELNYNYPDVISFAKKRYQQAGRNFNLTTWLDQIVVTPESMYRDKKLKTVKINPVDVLKNCPSLISK